VKTAKSWGLTPGAFRALPYSEQIEMMAEVDVTARMEAYEAQKAEKRMKQKQGTK